MYSVDCAKNGVQGSLMARTKNYDAILLDLRLPELMGNEVCAQVRAAGKNAPIVVMSVEADVPKKIELLNLGADDFLAKPFSFDELLARLRAVLRRPKALQEDILRFQDLALDLVRHRATLGEQEIRLTKKEFQLLEYLMRNRGIVVARSTLLENVWDDAHGLSTNTIEAHIRSIRKKMEAFNAAELIHTVPGCGYVFDVR